MVKTPVLKLRKDIWSHFPVNVDSMGRGANGADRYCVEWHNMKVRQMAKDAGKTEGDMKATLLPQLLHALAKSPAWKVEAPPPGSKCVAIIVMQFARANNTRKSPPKANNTHRRFNGLKNNVSRKKSKSPASATRKRSPTPNKAVNATRRAPKNHSALSGEAMIKKARGILNLMSAATVDRLSAEFATLSPKTVGESEALLHVVYEIALDQQAYHPLVIHLLHVLDSQHASRPYHEKPSAFVGERMVARAMEEPLFAKMEVAAEMENAPTNKNADDKIALQKRFFRSVMLFTGFMYRDALMPWTSYKRLLRHLANWVFETAASDLDYRVFDGYAQGLMYSLIRAGARMVAEGGAAAALFASLAEGISRLSVEAKRGYIRTDAKEFLASAEAGFKIKPGMTWTIGAPLTDVRVKAKSPAAAAPAVPAAAAPQGLGADIAELWRRFPLDVKQEGSMYIVRFHNKKLRERFEKEPAGKYRTAANLESTLAKHILGLVDNSAHWKRGPVVAGTLVTVVKR